MGSLIHGDREYGFEDRLLAHLQVAISQKLRKRESCFLSWVKPHGEGGGRASLWLSPFVTIAFKFSGNREPELSKTWLSVMGALSHTARGLIALSEEDARRFAKQNPSLY